MRHIGFVSALLLAGCAGSVSGPVSPSPTNEMQGAPITTTTTAIDWSFLATPTTIAPTTTTEAVTEPDSTVWDRLAECETGGNWSANTGNGFGGGVQFAHASDWSTWRAYGGEQFATDPWHASREDQITVAGRVLSAVGWQAWPGCARLLNLN